MTKTDFTNFAQSYSNGTFEYDNLQLTTKSKNFVSIYCDDDGSIQLTASSKDSASGRVFEATSYEPEKLNSVCDYIVNHSGRYSELCAYLARHFTRRSDLDF